MSARIDPFECRWRPSRWLPAFILLFQLLTLLVVLTSALSPTLQLALLLALGLHLLTTLPALLRPGAGGALRCEAKGWFMADADGQWQSIQLLPGSLALPGLILLHWRYPGQLRWHALCLLADSLPADAHRRLRLHLRWARCPGSVHAPRKRR